MKRFTSVFCFLLTSALVLAGCAGGTAATSQIKQYTEATTSIQAAAGEQFEIDLEGNPTTGYSWEKNEVYDKSMLELIQSKYSPSLPQKIGSGGAQQYIFKALKAGSTQVKMVYKRSWESTTSDKTLTFNVTIK